MERGKINSFTLFEIVLALMLAGIVVGMAYTAFTLFNKIYGDYHDKTSVHADMQSLKKVLNSDMRHSSLISLSGSQIRFDHADESLGLVYLIYPEHLIRRRDNLQDTFKMRKLLFAGSFEGNEVSTGVVDQLKFQFEFENAPIIIGVRKQYTSDELFNYKDSI